MGVEAGRPSATRTVFKTEDVSAASVERIGHGMGWLFGRWQRWPKGEARPRRYSILMAVPRASIKVLLPTPTSLPPPSPRLRVPLTSARKLLLPVRPGTSARRASCVGTLCAIQQMSHINAYPTKCGGRLRSRIARNVTPGSSSPPDWD